MTYQPGDRIQWRHPVGVLHVAGSPPYPARHLSAAIDGEVTAIDGEYLTIQWKDGSRGRWHRRHVRAAGKGITE